MIVMMTMVGSCGSVDGDISEETVIMTRMILVKEGIGKARSNHGRTNTSNNISR